MTGFTKQLLNWYAAHGRKTLPWQKNKTPYRVWVSEIMLQQTQVTTVIPYYQRFMQSFPNLKALAIATEDDVLHHWAGLGYYSRARNLHKAAKKIVSDFGGRFPNQIDDVISLPGIGRSTAGAILAFSKQQRHPILDGNVKRVLTRFMGIEGYPGNPAIETQLWELAEKLTPKKAVDDYTQAIMDLGATLCTRSKPSCTECPVKKHCQALATNRVDQLPTPKLKKSTPTRKCYFLIFRYQDKVLFIKRPSPGIWGGLWSFPELASDFDFSKLKPHCQKTFKLAVMDYETLSPIRHVFSHFKLEATPLMITIKQVPKALSEDWLWHNIDSTLTKGVAAPIKKLVQII